MALAFFLIGLILLFIGANGTFREAGQLIKEDFTGPNNFIVWLVAILLAGAFGYIPKFKPVSYAFLILVFVAIFLSSGSGFFTNFNKSVKELTT